MVPYRWISTSVSKYIYIFVAIATRILDVGTKWIDVHNLHIAICPCFKFHEKIWRTFKVIAGSRKVWLTDRQTDRQSANHRSPPVTSVGDTKMQYQCSCTWIIFFYFYVSTQIIIMNSSQIDFLCIYTHYNHELIEDFLG